MTAKISMASSAALTAPSTATVAINGGANAALLAAQIIAVEDAELARKLDEKRAKDAAVVLEKDAAICAQFQK